MIGRCIVFSVAASVLLVSLCAAALGTSLEQAFFPTLGQIAHMAIYYPVWAWLLFLALLVAGTRVWGLIGAVLDRRLGSESLIQSRAAEKTGKSGSDLLQRLNP